MSRRSIWSVLAGTLFPALSVATRAEHWAVPALHPRLLIGHDEVAALRVRCGIDRYRDDPAARAVGMKFGSQREVVDRLKAVARAIMAARARRDDLFVPAILHLAVGELARPDEYTQYVASELLDPGRRRLELDGVVALDYCWDAIEPEKRSRIVERLTRLLEALDPGGSPLDHFTFHRKLCRLAAAIVLYAPKPGDENSEASARSAAVISAAQDYLEGPFVTFCRQRGPMPTSGGSGIREEADIVLAVELWGSATGRSLWPKLAGSVGRSMEHYFYADTDYEGLDHGFIHDHGSHVPLGPGRSYCGFLPAVPWAIARHTGDPIATWYANRSLPPVLPAPVPQVDRYQWVRLIYGPLDQPEAARRACPLGRDFGGGWVAMRSGWAGGDTVLLFDAGQPFWQSRQHFDAGQFQIYRKGRLAIDSGDDVTYEAVLSKRGKTTIGGRRGDWDHYAQATIAHNCVTVADRRSEMQLYGRPWPAMGNQRLIEHDYDPSAGEVTRTNRQTGTLTAFETNSFYSYAAADLTAAYPPEVVRSIRRQILFINSGAVLVLDRITAAKARSIKTWHLQLPGRPKVLADGSPRREVAPGQIHGVNPDGGIWALAPDQNWLEVTHQDGRLFVRTLLPAGARRRIVGGPMRPRQIPAGSMAGRTYFGGDPFGYEHRLWPASILRAPNAAYELGRPTGLGPNFGVGATWGRLEVLPEDDLRQVTFLHLLIPTDRFVETPPAASFETHDNQAIAEIELPDHHARVELDTGDDPTGMVTLREPGTGDILFQKSLAARVHPNAEIPGSQARRRADR